MRRHLEMSAQRRKKTSKHDSNAYLKVKAALSLVVSYELDSPNSHTETVTIRAAIKPVRA